MSLGNLGNTSGQDIILKETTNCFGGCIDECNTFSTNLYGDSISVETPYCMLALDDAIIIGGSRNDWSFLMMIDTFGNVLNHWLFNFGSGDEHIQKIIRTPDNKIVGYGNFEGNAHNSDFYFLFDYLNEELKWGKQHNLLGEVRFLDIEIEPTSPNFIIVGSQKINGEELGLALRFQLLSGTSNLAASLYFPAETADQCFFTSLASGSGNLNAFGGISDSNSQLRNAAIRVANPTGFVLNTQHFANLSPNEFIEDRISIGEGVAEVSLIKSQKVNDTKCRHFLHIKEGGEEYEKMIDFDIDFEENVVFQLIPIDASDGFLIAGNGHSGANCLTKISLNGELEWSKLFQTDQPLSFSVLGDFIYFSFAEINGSNQDIAFGRLDMNGKVSGGCNFIEEFQPLFLEATPSTLVSYNFGDIGNISPFEMNAGNSSVLIWDIPPSTILCEKECLEICNNQIDDDSDGLIDAYDPDCDCQIAEKCTPQSYLACEDLPCPFSYELTDVETIEADTLWSHPMSLEGQAPSVGDVDGDCVPDVIIHSGLAVGVLDSRDGSLKYSADLTPFMNPFLDNPTFVGQTAIGDVDLDGMAEIFVSIHYSENSTNTLSAIARFDFNPATNQLEEKQNWTTNHFYSINILHSPSLADFNGDSRPEIYIGNIIIDAQTGNRIVNPSTDGSTGNPPYFHLQSGSVAADVSNASDCHSCYGLELVAGNQVYSVTLFSEAVFSFNSMKVVREMPNMPDGYTQLADFDNDGDLDAIVASDDGDNGALLYVWDIQTETLIGNPVEDFAMSSFSHDISLPSIGDVDGDGWVEIVVPTNNRLTILEDYQNGGGTNWGTVPETLKATLSNDFTFPNTMAPLFDINGDGASELFFADLNKFGILDENLNWVGQPLPWSLTIPQHFGTYPVIADINGDGFTEVLIKNGVDIFALKLNIPMPKTRPIWNQHNYFITNVLDNGELPKSMQNHHLPGGRKLNGFRMQQPIFNQDTLPIFNVTDAVLKDLNSYCEDGQMVVEVEVCNEGNIDIPAGIPISFYDGNPLNGNALIMETLKSDTLIESNDCQTFLFELKAHLNTPIFVFFNDKGTNDLPMSLSQDFPNSWLPECDFSNNFDEFILDFLSPELDLGNDTLICGTGVFDFNASSNFVKYEWQDGSEDSTFTTWLPGLFWVEVTDSCGGLFRDSVRVEMLMNIPVSNNADTTICLGEEVTLNAFTDFKSIQWFPKALFECDTCFSTMVSPDTTTQVILIGKTDEECFNVDTILIEVVELKVDFQTTQSCNGAPDGNAKVHIENGTEPYDYQWDVTNENRDSISSLLPGEYFLTITDARGCTKESSVFIEQTNTEHIEFDIRDASCFGEMDASISLITDDQNLEFSLNGNDFQKTNVFENLEAGTYHLFVLDSNNCITDAEVIIDQPTDLLLVLPDDITVELGEHYQIFPNINASQNADFQWVNEVFLDCTNCKNPISTPSETTTYTLLVTDTTGCETQDNITIFVRNSKRVYIPNSFSPNGDGINDRFYPFGGMEVAQIRAFKIFDRWGNLVFENTNFPPNDASFGWDGMMNNQEMNSAVYVYYSEIEYSNGEIEIRKGDVILVK